MPPVSEVERFFAGGRYNGLRLVADGPPRSRDLSWLPDIAAGGMTHLYLGGQYDLSSVIDVSWVGLKSLELNVPGNPSRRLDWSKFPDLRELDTPETAFNFAGSEGAKWRLDYLGLRSIASKQILLQEYGNPLTAVLGPAPQLSEIVFTSTLRTVSLTVNDARKLQNLELSEIRLVELNLDGCRGIDTVDFLEQQSSIRKVGLVDCGKIRSLEALRGLAKLQEVWFSGDTDILDGKVAFLSDLPEASVVWFRNRRHYDARREQLGLSPK